MKNPIELLQEEHTFILEAIEIGKEIQKVEEDKVYFNLIHDFILFIRNYTEIYHYPKEENIFYPLLRNRSEKMTDEFIHEVCDNHEDFKSMMAEIENAFTAHDYSLLRNTMGKYIAALEDHIKRENKIILSAANKLLKENELESISKEFKILDEKYGDKEQLIKNLYKINLQSK